jgi:HEAT repeat protein
MRKALLRSSSPKVVDELVNSGSIIEDQRVVRDIARTLTRIANPGAVDRLLAGLESSNISIAAGCAAALATIGNREAIQGLVSVYPQADQERKMVLLEAISRVKNQEALPAVNQALSRADIDANLRQTLNRTLDMISNR